MVTAALVQPLAARVACRTCHDDGVLHATEYVNGRDVEVTEPCPDCGEPPDDYDDRDGEDRWSTADDLRCQGAA